MPFPLSGPGVGLPLPQSLYPPELTNAPYDTNTNFIALAAGTQLPIPAGNWWVDTGLYSFIQYRDPVQGAWTFWGALTWNQGPVYIKSDGFNFRIANLLGVAVGGVVIAPGNGSYVQASTTVAVTGGGGSTWQAIVGGNLIAPSAISVGAGYGVPPIVMIPAPAGPQTNPNGVGGVQASAYATITSGTVTNISMTNPGAGYVGGGAGTTLIGICVPNPTDPNIATGITNATVRFSVSAPGSITGIINTNPGATVSTPANITLTVSGAGANGTVAPVILQTIVAASITGGSTLAIGTVNALITGVGGAWPTSSFAAGPEQLGLMARPRLANITAALGAIGTLAAGTITAISAATGQIVDGGLYFGLGNALGTPAGNPPTPVLLNGSGLLTAATGTIIGSSTIAFTMGSRPDNVRLTPAP